MYDDDMRCFTCDRRMCFCADHTTHASGTDCACADRTPGLGLLSWGLAVGHPGAVAIGLEALG